MPQHHHQRSPLTSSSPLLLLTPPTPTHLTLQPQPTHLDAQPVAPLCARVLECVDDARQVQRRRRVLGDQVDVVAHAVVGVAERERAVVEVRPLLLRLRCPVERERRLQPRARRHGEGGRGRRSGRRRGRDVDGHERQRLRRMRRGGAAEERLEGDRARWDGRQGDGGVCWRCWRCWCFECLGCRFRFGRWGRCGRLWLWLWLELARLLCWWFVSHTACFCF